MTTTKQYDYLNRLQQISSLPATSVSPGAIPISFGYQYNDANQRTRATFADGSFWAYRYDSLGQVIRGKKYWSDGTPVAGQQFEYGFDDIGNRTSTKAGGDATGNSAVLRSASYTPNFLNQYLSRTVPGGVDVIGLADAGSTVSINNDSGGAYRRGQYFRKELAVNNSSSAVWQDVTVTTSGGGTNPTGDVFVPAATENYSYDLDGNLTQDGRWTYTWDAENRLIRMVANTAVGPQQRVDFEYDWQGRRISKKVWNNTAGTGNPAVWQKFIYDGWNLIAILNSDLSLQTSFLWGLDLSGSAQGAGGVAGLLAVNDTVSGVHFAAYDGNGNVSAMVKETDGTVSANYEYDPFWEVIRATGPMAKMNSFRWSTKYQDDESDLLYYGYRYYNASTGRWLSRDPLEELGFTLLSGGTQTTTGMEFDDESSGAPISERGDENLYVFVGNDPISFLDILGLVDFRFEPVVGELGGMIVGAGHWGQPFNYADGSASSGSKSAHTFIKVWSGPTSAGSCNTVKFKGKYGDNAGAITVYAQDKCPGKYKIYFDLTYEIKTTGPRGNALLKVDKITESEVGRTATIKKKNMIAVVVNLPANQEATILRYDPTISSPPEPKKRNSTGSIDFNVEVVRVKKLD